MHTVFLPLNPKNGPKECTSGFHVSDEESAAQRSVSVCLCVLLYLQVARNTTLATNSMSQKTSTNLLSLGRHTSSAAVIYGSIGNNQLSGSRARITSSLQQRRRSLGKSYEEMKHVIGVIYRLREVFQVQQRAPTTCERTSG